MTIKELRDKQWIIYEIIAGSKLYNIDNENSDVDIRGIFNVPLYQYLCQRYPTKVVVNNEDTDAVFMEIITYLNLACAGNPNVVDWLYAKDAEKQCKSLEMCELIDIRNKFITKTFLKKSLSMGQSMIERCKKKEDKQWKMLAHAQRILYTVYTKVLNPIEIYSPEMTGIHREGVMQLKDGKGDYWEEVARLEQGLEGWFSLIDEAKDIPEKCDNELKDELILQFKTKYYGIETP